MNVLELNLALDRSAPAPAAGAADAGATPTNPDAAPQTSGVDTTSANL